MNAKKAYTTIAKGLFVMAISSTMLQVLFSLIAGWLGYNSSYQNIMTWVITFVPLYFVGIPLYYLIVRNLPVENFETKKVKFEKLILMYIQCMGITYVGNLIGTGLSTLLSYVLTNEVATNPLNDLVFEGNGTLILVIVSIVAPILEELVFRKFLIDRTIQYGEKAAIIFSALSFGLFHMNLYQFFYAFGAGLIFAYIYVRTRNIKYTIAFHVVINFFGGVIAPKILSLLSDVYYFQGLINSGYFLEYYELIDMLLPVIIVCVYGIVMAGLSITGIVILIQERKNFYLIHTENEITKENTFEIVYKNIFYILFVILCIVMIVLAII